MTGITGVSPNAINVPVYDPALAEEKAQRKQEQQVFAPVEETNSADQAKSRANERPAQQESRSVQQNDVQLYEKISRQPESTQNEEITSASPQSTAPEQANSISRSEQPQQEQSTAQEQRLEQQQQRDEVEARKEQILAEQDQKVIEQLAARDREVKAHEQAHKAVGGQYAGAMSFTYQRGPDGVNYAVGGEVQIDTGKVPGDPQATLDKAQQVRRAALAPAEPSSQDRRVAALASQMILEAQSEIRQQADAQESEKAEEREESQAVSDRADQLSEASSVSEAEKDEKASEENRERIQEIFNSTKEINDQLAALENVEQRQAVIGNNIDFVI